MIILNSKQLGRELQAARKQQGLTQAQLATHCGVGSRFIRELENGKPSCQLEKVLTVVQMLGIRINLEAP